MVLSLTQKILFASFGFFLILGIGASLSATDFLRATRQRKALLTGLLCQYLLMPFLAFILSRVLNLPAEAGLGLFLLGCTAAGSTPNAFTYFAKGDVAFSIALSITATLVNLLTMPVLLYLYSQTLGEVNIVIPFGRILLTLPMMIFPVFIGMTIRQKNPLAAQKVEKGGKLLGLGSLVGILISMGPGLLEQIRQTPGPLLLAAVALPFLGYFLAYLVGGFALLNQGVRKAISLGSGTHNAPVTFAIILLSFPGEAAARIIMIPLLYSFLVIGCGALTVMILRSRLFTSEAP